jgi:hypothetical protein
MLPIYLKGDQGASESLSTVNTTLVEGALTQFYTVLGLADDITTNSCDLAIDYSRTIQEILIGSLDGSFCFQPYRCQIPAGYAVMDPGSYYKDVPFHADKCTFVGWRKFKLPSKNIIGWEGSLPCWKDYR